MTNHYSYFWVLLLNNYIFSQYAVLAYFESLIFFFYIKIIIFILSIIPWIATSDSIGQIPGAFLDAGASL